MNASCIHWTLKELKKRFAVNFPQMMQAAAETVSLEEFKREIATLFPHDTVLELIRNDGKTITDFSTDKKVHIQTFGLLHAFLRGETGDTGSRTRPDETNMSRHTTATDSGGNQAGADLLTDLYFIFRNTREHAHDTSVSETKVLQWARQWSSGLNPAIQQAREANKQRIIGKLIQRLGRRLSVNTPYYLPQFRSFEEKQKLVNEWWNSHRFHLHMAIKNPDELNFYLDQTLSEETMRILHDARKKNIPFFITPYYASLLDVTGNGYDDKAIRSYVLYSKELVETFGEIKAWEKEDEVEAGKANAAGWILPEGHNIHRRYPEVAILIPDSIGRACGGLCASCQRMYDFQSRRLNFNLKELAPKESWPIKLKKLMNYFEEDTQLRDILITGGDALMSRNATLRNLFEAIYKMALQKRKANESRPDGEKFAEIQRIRLGTRLPVYLPMRVDDELISILKEFKEKASKIRITQLIVQTHFQTPLEMTKEASEAIRRIISAGWIVTNQLVYNVAASRRGHTAALRKTLINNGVVPYYTFAVKGFRENYDVYAPIARSMQERAEEKFYGLLNDEEQDEFVEILQNRTPYTKEVNLFLQNKKHRFIATDRSVLNLPGIGKSMTFKLVGITGEGKRILCFDHDPTRRHSPVIKNFGKIYITENKSILAYLKQLEEMGEDVKAYQSIWEYTGGVTEPKFKLYEYPALPFRTTETISHVKTDG
ncbi:MAG: KamA family protein [Tannerella sp.]|jgi:lysine 2,3-aminomutase|nr:KamA family protein [Tannerella sp.]